MGYIVNTSKFKELSRLIKPVIGWKIDVGNADVYYFDWLGFSVAGFPQFLNALARLSGDQKFYFYDVEVAQEKSGIDEYYKNFMFYPMIEFSSEITEDEYFFELSKKYYMKNYFIGEKERTDKIRDRLFMVSTTCAYAIFPKSMKWHIYGEYDIELARLVTKVGLPKDVPFPHDFIPEEEAKRLISLKE